MGNLRGVSGRHGHCPSGSRRDSLEGGWGKRNAVGVTPFDYSIALDEDLELKNLNFG